VILEVIVNHLVLGLHISCSFIVKLLNLNVVLGLSDIHRDMEVFGVNVSLF
jgi:hypothetical protein